MSKMLKQLFETRGTQTRLAQELDVSNGYLSELAHGKKGGSRDIWTRIAAATGLSLDGLLREAGFSEPDATPYEPGPAANSMLAAARALAPNARHLSFFRATMPQAAFGLLVGDLLVIEASFDPADIDDGALIVANVTPPDGGESHTVIGRAAGTLVMGGDARRVGQIGTDTAPLGVVLAVMRPVAETASPPRALPPPRAA